MAMVSTIIDVSLYSRMTGTLSLLGSEEGIKDVETLFFGSTHEKDNYPGTGQDPTPYIGDQVQNPVHRRIVNRYLSSGSKSRYKSPSRISVAVIQ
jgi:hypothetical protein